MRPGAPMRWTARYGLGGDFLSGGNELIPCSDKKEVTLARYCSPRSLQGWPTTEEGRRALVQGLPTAQIWPRCSIRQTCLLARRAPQTISTSNTLARWRRRLRFRRLRRSHRHDPLAFLAASTTHILASRATPMSKVRGPIPDLRARTRIAAPAQISPHPAPGEVPRS